MGEDAGQLDEAEDVLCDSLIAGADTTEGLQPSDGTPHLPAPPIASEKASVPGFPFPVAVVGCDHSGAELLKLGLEAITVIRLVTDEALGKNEAERGVSRNSVNSAELALLVCTASGVPLASMMIMLSVLLPFLVGSTSAPLFWRH